MWQSIAYYSALVVESVVGVFGVRLYEEPRYDVIERVNDAVEIRRYAPRLAAEVDLVSSDDAGRREAFQLLFNYIAGANSIAGATSTVGTAADRIAMTAPVEVSGRTGAKANATTGEKALVAMTVPVETSDTARARHMRFFVPAKYTLATAPKPLNPRVQLVTVPEQTIATLRFSGTGRDAGARKAELVDKLSGTPWKPDGEPYTLFYDAPFTLPFLRRNEAAVTVTRAQ
jgi:hypothetical protein